MIDKLFEETDYSSRPSTSLAGGSGVRTFKGDFSESCESVDFLCGGGE